MSAPTRTNADTARRVYEVFGAGDIPGLLAMLSEDVAWESDWEDNFAQRPGGPAFYRPFSGRSNLGPFFDAMGRNEFSMLELRDVIADGDRVVCRVALAYTLPGGGRYRDEQLHLWTFDKAGAITSVRHFLDTAKLLAAAAGEDTTVRAGDS
ncbi:nuclear transport factor 2 family protein [Actinomycetospora termitidis]|uniref:Nuclear transport factor 2 family protein n=1 Tax=Actinomycetospora termitidis TaxID=3053470 RepID=A0ABT7MC70_9PSEU|nr:nuclear transport factor 2 family protein [Actinomycetospora sp. Odt1-22]MDL5158266.1 nuclear transport factor 2 family protein [Actinomycetospora sp. Odt1-22]